jgi:hypothetical protein
VQHLPLRHQLLHRPGDVLDGDLGVDPVLVEQVDAVGPKTLQHALDDELDVRGLAVEARPALAGRLVDVPAELRRDHDLVAERRDGLAEDALALVRPVRLGTVEEGDAPIVRGAEDVDHVRAVRHRRLIATVHVLHADPDARDLELAQSATAHRRRLRGVRRP